MANKSKHVLVAPLDWGLGHATRCIPIVSLLQQKGFQVSIASSGNAQQLLRLEFPDLEFYELPTYGPLYSERVPFMMNMFFQIPKFLWVINKERKKIEEIVADNKIDLIISDNRYGCRHASVPSVFISHQLNLIMPKGLMWFASVVNYFNHRWINSFDASWIPDDPVKALSGKLSHPILNKSIHIGALSRFTKEGHNIDRYQLAVILSGPEPHRSIFEKIVKSQLHEAKLKCVLVRGLFGEVDNKSVEGDIAIYNYLKSADLQNLINESSMILCRSGYTSILDMAVLGKKVIFVPTPGQTEQEYLATLLMEKLIAPYYSQHDFSLVKALREMKKYKGFEGWDSPPNLLDHAITRALV